MQCNEILSFPSLNHSHHSRHPCCHFHQGARTGGRVPLLHKRPLSGHSPLSLSLSSQHLHKPRNHHITPEDESFRFFPPYLSYLEWGLGNLGRCIGKSNIFCARVLWTEILALNWIRCRRSNSKTMKRENSEAKPLLKWLSQDQAISKTYLLSTLSMFKNLTKNKVPAFSQPIKVLCRHFVCCIGFLRWVFRTRSFYNIGPILRTTSFFHTCTLTKLTLGFIICNSKLGY